ncbi:DNA/RNA nuclease SfsA [Acidaminobacter hydrogenoformans]|uniref:Sugar fermentation stimulation protein homolog n=1 Tax=Acidaminobacter hydrogenoformans DSM 2784 TaxID=1120920 RepID=A0A1G5S0C7_9FIRM|nr:DNA/RNA nuclease SfsA [Acidaminobacter hydrogenoformans]SCZ79834.1 sugar fermentation stimulation protein A [Acidaminobacter hydrogenoformans DSM 2784]
MRYDNIKPGTFIKRPNRFVAHIEVDGKIEICHVKNTGRCRELLPEGARVLVQDCGHPGRKTRYDLISVWKGDRLVNMDSQAPNKVFREWAESSGYFGKLQLIKPEQKYGSSRFDFYLEAPDRRIFVEVKGVTLEEEGVVRFPDAPTERGVKHLNELRACLEDGYEAMVAFIIQMKNVDHFEPNDVMHPAFGESLRKLAESGGQVIALDCLVTETVLAARDFVEVRL